MKLFTPSPCHCFAENAAYFFSQNPDIVHPLQTGGQNEFPHGFTTGYTSGKGQQTAEIRQQGVGPEQSKIESSDRGMPVSVKTTAGTGQPVGPNHLAGNRRRGSLVSYLAAEQIHAAGQLLIMAVRGADRGAVA